MRKENTFDLGLNGRAGFGDTKIGRILAQVDGAIGRTDEAHESSHECSGSLEGLDVAFLAILLFVCCLADFCELCSLLPTGSWGALVALKLYL